MHKIEGVNLLTVLSSSEDYYLDTYCYRSIYNRAKFKHFNGPTEFRCIYDEYRLIMSGIQVSSLLLLLYQ